MFLHKTGNFRYPLAALVRWANYTPVADDPERRHHKRDRKPPFAQNRQRPEGSGQYQDSNTEMQGEHRLHAAQPSIKGRAEGDITASKMMMRTIWAGFVPDRGPVSPVLDGAPNGWRCIEQSVFINPKTRQQEAWPYTMVFKGPASVLKAARAAVSLKFELSQRRGVVKSYQLKL